jgi:hypothetical protein
MYAFGVKLDRAAWTAATAGVTLLALFGGTLPARRRALPPSSPVEPAREPSGVLAGTAARAAMAPAAIAAGSTATGATATGPAATGATATGPTATRTGTTVMTVLAAPASATTTGPGRSADPATATENGDPDGPDNPDGPGDDAASGGTGRRGLLRQVLPLVLALAVLGGASWLSYSSARDGFETTVTTLSAEPPAGMNPAGLRTVRVSATGLLAEAGPYRLVVTGENGGVIIERSVAAAGGSWAEALNLPGRQRLTVHLYRGADGTPYRTLLISPQE